MAPVVVAIELAVQVSECELFILIFAPAVREPSSGFGLLGWH